MISENVYSIRANLRRRCRSDGAPSRRRSVCMSEIRLEKVTKVYAGGVTAVSDVDLTVASGEFMVLVGPSGCGKSTLLRMIAGLEEVTDGGISIGERDVTDLAPRQRDIAMVFQNYALYPHMDVRKNLGYALKVRKMPKEEVDRRVNQVAKMLGLDELLDRRPGALSGGQRRRGGGGRGIGGGPAVSLRDEPLSNLDAKLRVGMRAELSRLHERLGITTVYVTHDQVEAMTLGQRVAVMRDGVIQQVDTPQELYRRPANLFVGAFIGSPAMNLVDAVVEGGRVSFAGLELPRTRDVRAGKVILGIRPEAFEDAALADPGLPVVDVDVVVLEELGSDTHVIFRIDAPRVEAEDLRAAADEEDEGLLVEDRAVWNARVGAKSGARAGERLRLAVDP